MRAVPRLRAFRAWLLLLAGLLGAATAPAAPQEPPTPSFQDEVSVGLVLVPVVVRSGGGYAKNLGQDDFRLLVEGQPVTIESFERRSDAPASVVVLQDLSGSMATGGNLEKSREVDDVRHQYVLGFSTGDGAVKFRQLQVQVNEQVKNQRTIVFRRGYKGTPPARSRAGG